MTVSLAEATAAAFAVPPVMLGNAPEPETWREAARLRLAYYETLDMNPPDGDEEAVRVLIEDRLRAMGVGGSPW